MVRNVGQLRFETIGVSMNLELFYRNYSTVLVDKIVV